MSKNTTKETWVLPDNVAKLLQDAYSEYREAVSTRASGDAKREALKTLASIAKAGRSKGWPYPEMAEPCQITAERLRQVLAEFDDKTKNPEGLPVSDDVKDAFPKYLARPSQRKGAEPNRRKTKRSKLTDAESQRLKELAVEARKNSGSTALNSPVRRASVEFSKLIIRLHDRGVTWKALAEASGHSISGLRMRAARHGYNSGPPPSIPAYRGTTIYEQAKIKKREEEKRKPAA